MRLLRTCIFIALGIIGRLFGQVPESTSNLPKAETILGITTNEAWIAETPSSSGGLYEKRLSRGRVVVLYAKLPFQSKYGAINKEFYKIAYKAKLYVIENKDIRVIKGLEDKLDMLPTDANEDQIKFAIEASQFLAQANFNELLKEIQSHKKDGIVVVNAEIAKASEYTQGTNFNIKVLNPTDKDIKYIWFTVIGLNAVNDPVKERIKNSAMITVKGIGPIKKNAVGEYNWEYMWHTDIVESFKINSIKIQYMDNSVRTVSDWKSVRLSTKSRNTLDEPEE
jgi:hypothetical protein